MISTLSTTDKPEEDDELLLILRNELSVDAVDFWISYLIKKKYKSMVDSMSELLLHFNHSIMRILNTQLLEL